MFCIKLFESCNKGIEGVFHVHVANVTPHLIVFVQSHLGLFQFALLVAECVTADIWVNVTRRGQ